MLNSTGPGPLIRSTEEPYHPASASMLGDMGAWSSHLPLTRPINTASPAQRGYSNGHPRRSRRLLSKTDQGGHTSHDTASYDVRGQSMRLIAQELNEVHRPPRHKQFIDRTTLICTHEDCCRPNDPFAGRLFAGPYELKRHRDSVHAESPIRYRCSHCKKSRLRKDKLVDQCRRYHGEGWNEGMVNQEARDPVALLQTALGRYGC